jgi:hypothetical protein
MRLVMTLALITSVSGCWRGAASPEAICDGTEISRTEHAAALVADGGPRSVATGARLIRQIDAGCAR